MLVASVMAFPLMVRATRLAIEAVDPKLEQAVTTLGVGPIRVFLTITVPMMAPGLVLGGDASAVRLLVLSVFISVLALALSEWMARRFVHGTGQ